MAVKVTETLIDDVDGGIEGVQKFVVNGYEIDLGGSNATALQAQLDLVKAHGRRSAGKPAVAAGGRGKRGKNPETAVLRAWALENGKISSTRGRIPEAVEAEWRAATA